MDKRSFLKISSALFAGALLASCGRVERTNWAGNLTYSTDRLHLPRTVGEVQDIVASHRKICPLGSRHCFNAIADSTENQISLQHLNRIVELDEEARTVTVEAGIRYGELCPQLHERGYAVHNLASLPHISIAGACATATHGSGVTNGNLATAVSAIEFVDATGEMRSLSRAEDRDTISGAVVGLGGLGVVTRLMLDLEPAFDMRQHVYLSLPLSAMEEHFDEFVSSGYSVSFFTDWRTEQASQVWIKRVATKDCSEPAPTLFGAALATRNVHPILALSAESCTDQMGLQSRYEKLPAFRDLLHAYDPDAKFRNAFLQTNL